MKFDELARHAVAVVEDYLSELVGAELCPGTPDSHRVIRDGSPCPHCGAVL